MLYIALVGCGQIGSRHLQSLAQLDEPTTVYLIDPFPDSINVAKERFNEVLSEENENNFKLFSTSIEQLEGPIDFAIISSNSSVRAELTKKLLSRVEPTHLILEKYLFQKQSDYDDIRNIIDSSNTSVWVNQWISSSYAFRRVAAWLGKQENISMKIYGQEWGLGCNAVHFIDYFDFLTERKSMKVTDYLFDEKFCLSKRDGFCEVIGHININSENGSTLELQSQYGESDGIIKIDIESPNRSVKLEMNAGKLNCSFSEGGKIWDEKFKLKFQSNLTHRIIEDLLQYNRCNLPDYARSCTHHLLIQPCFEKYFSEHSEWNGDDCPIT